MTRRTTRARTTTSRTRRRRSSSPETQLTGAFNRLVDQRPVVAAIVAAHDGTVTAAQAPGGGARFVVELPLATQL